MYCHTLSLRSRLFKHLFLQQNSHISLSSNVSNCVDEKSRCCTFAYDGFLRKCSRPNMNTVRLRTCIVLQLRDGALPWKIMDIAFNLIKDLSYLPLKVFCMLTLLISSHLLEGKRIFWSINWG